MTKPRLLYRASVNLWWRQLHGRFWVGPYATAQGAATLAIHEEFTEEQREAWRNRNWAWRTPGLTANRN